MHLSRIASGAALVLLWLLAGPVFADEWTENSFRDFRDGSFADGGSNLYVSASGRLQLINRWDLNGDGFLDVVLPSGHGHTEKEDTYIYLNRGGDISGRSLIRLPANGSTDGLVRDFDKDGLNDLAVCNGDNGITTRTDSYIYYGTKSGFSVERRLTLAAHDSSSIAAGDFNGDGWVDLAIACRWQAGDFKKSTGPQMSFVYWNGPAGFSAENRVPFTFRGKGARAVVAGDLDADKRDDLIWITGNAVFIHYSKRGPLTNSEKAAELSTGGAAAEIGDVNGDGKADLAVCSGSAVNIYSGVDNGLASEPSIKLNVDGTGTDVAVADFDTDGKDDVAVSVEIGKAGPAYPTSYVFYSDGGDFSTRKPTKLITMEASAVSAADLNGDGRPDLVISNRNVLNQNSLPSSVFWNDGGRQGGQGGFRHGNHTQLETQGSIGNAIGDVDNDGKPDVVFFNFEGNFRDGPAKTTVYWGDGSRNYTPQRSRDFLSHYINGIGQADLDDDGSVELVMAQTRFSNAELQEWVIPIIIEWNGPKGFTGVRSNLTVDEPGGGVKVADFNRDGYLDLLVGGKIRDPHDPSKSGIPLFWGSAQGFSHHHKALIPIAGGEDARVPAVADLNNDGYLDLATQLQAGHVTVWHGGDDGFVQSRTATIETGRDDAVVFIQAADLNKDGWLDLILPTRQVGKDSEVTSYVYYGSSSGFANDRRVELPTYGPYDPCVADFDKDGWLDVFLNSYKGNLTRNWPSLIYWGGPEGLLKRERTTLPTYSCAGAETADYDGDGWIDILCANHRIDGFTDKPGPHNHTTVSMLYWGGAGGFSPERRLDLPSIGPHALNLRDVGNAHDRGLYEDYVSSPHAIPTGERPSRIRWLAQTPHGTSVRFQLRTAASADALRTAAWRGPDDSKDWFTASDASVGEVDGRWIQYRARLTTPNGGSTPYLTSVTIEFAKG